MFDFCPSKTWMSHIFSQGLATSLELLDYLREFFQLHTFDMTHSMSCLICLAYKNLGLAPQNHMSEVKTALRVLPLEQPHSGAPL